MAEPIPFQIERVEAAVRQRIPSIGVLWNEETESTNQDARDLVRLRVEPWTVVVAGRQHRGKGRYDRPWASPPGGLYQSLVLRLPAIESPLTLIPLIAGLSMKEAIESDLARHGGGQFRGWLKWPNDLISSRGKLAGILCEATQQGDHWDVIVGCGLNIKPVEPGAVDDVHHQAMSSLGSEHPGVPWRREDLLIGYLLRMDSWLRRWQDDPAEVRQAWLDASGVEGKSITATSSGRKIEGVALGIDNHGALIVDTGKTKEVVNAAEALIVHEAMKY